MLVPANESKEKTRKYEEPWIRSIVKNSFDCDKKYMKFKSNLDDQLPLNKTIEIPTIAIAVRAVSHENNKYYPQFFR